MATSVLSPYGPPSPPCIRLVKDKGDYFEALTGTAGFVIKVIGEAHDMYEMERQDHVANFLVPSLLSAYDLDASDAVLEHSYRHVAAQLEKLRPSPGVIHQGNWKEYLGQKSYYSAYVQFFDQCIGQEGLERTFYTIFPQLIPGLVVSSLSPLLHLGFGIETQHPLIVAEGLAYMCITYADPGPSLTDLVQQQRACRRPMSCTDILETIAEDKRFDGSFDQATFAAKLKVVLSSRGDLIKTYTRQWGVDGLSETLLVERLDELSVLLANLVLSLDQTNHDPNLQPPPLDPYLVYTLLPVTRAVRFMIDHLPSLVDKQRLVKVLWCATISYFVIQGRPAVNTHTPPDDTPDWNEMILRALASGDPRVVIVIRTLFQWEERHFCSVFPMAAQAVLNADASRAYCK
ncbi:hypothetical protein BZG36_04986 [Bifiguratus adelaidae]|uniref:Uncharacterized protein n=1 Tax=Bifiguratus adelaidae TaxID=1938954 RepID=A0A261XUC8_9FUNG|nr:hypothetical protein BZG36_04986 [Bifiguratus adelaidae]